LLLNSGKYSAEEMLVSFSYLARFVIYLSAGLVLFNQLKSGQLSKESVIKYIIYSGVVLVALGFIQLLLLPDFAVLDSS